MITLDEKKIKSIKLGELFGYLFIAVAGAGMIFFVVCYTIAKVKNASALLTLTYILAPMICSTGTLIAAILNLKYGRMADRMIKKYILDICLENPKAMHPERDSLTFYIEQDGCTFLMHANGYKDNLVFDFSAFRRLTFSRRAAIATEISNRIIVSFCKLYERGATYKDVSYIFKKGSSDKAVPIIAGGVPDKKSFKIYLKNKN